MDLIAPNWLDILTSDFMKRAFVAGTLVAITAGIVGYFIILRRLVFASHALAHIGFPGATAAALLGISVTWGLGVFCISGAIAIAILGRRAEREVATGSILAFATALGLLFANLGTGQTNLITNVLFGNLLAVSRDQIYAYAIFTAVLILVLAAISRPLLYSSVSPDLAAARGAPDRALSGAFMVTAALAITMAVPFVGTLLIFALLVTPAAAAIAITANPPKTVALSVAFALLSVWLGLFCSVLFDLSASFFIVAISFSAWLIATQTTGRRARISPSAA